MRSANNRYFIYVNQFEEKILFNALIANVNIISAQIIGSALDLTEKTVCILASKRMVKEDRSIRLRNKSAPPFFPAK